MQSLEDRTRCWMIVHEAENPWIEDDQRQNKIV